VSNGNVEWMRKAACKGAFDVFFPAQQSHLQAAKKFCAACPVQLQCREFAVGMVDSINRGVWGGKSVSELTDIRNERQATTNRPCTNPTCSNMLPQDPPHGQPRKYCSTKCARVCAARRYDKRRKISRGNPYPYQKMA
jgi:hypothetical protein